MGKRERSGPYEKAPREALRILRRARIAEKLAAGYLRGSKPLADELAEEGIVNPTTGNPWSHQTILDDIEVIRAEWLERMQGSMDDLRAEHLAALDQVQAAAFGDGSWSGALRALKQKAELLGLDEPTQVLVMEQTGEAIDQVLRRVDLEFGDEPEILQRFYRAIGARPDSPTGGPASRADEPSSLN